MKYYLITLNSSQKNETSFIYLKNGVSLEQCLNKESVFTAKINEALFFSELKKAEATLQLLLNMQPSALRIQTLEMY